MFKPLFLQNKHQKLPFVIKPANKDIKKETLTHDAEYIYMTKQPISDEIIQYILSDFNRHTTKYNIFNKNVYNWIVHNKEKVELVNDGTVQYDTSLDTTSPEYYRSAKFDTDTGLASLGFFILYSEDEHKFSVQINNPNQINKKCYPDIDIRNIYKSSQTLQILDALATACEFIPVTICYTKDRVYINKSTSPLKIRTPGRNIIKNIYIMKYLLETNWFSHDTIDPDKNYVILRKDNIIWLRPAKNQKGD